MPPPDKKPTSGGGGGGAGMGFAGLLIILLGALYYVSIQATPSSRQGSPNATSTSQGGATGFVQFLRSIAGFSAGTSSQVYQWGSGPASSRASSSPSSTQPGNPTGNRSPYYKRVIIGSLVPGTTTGSGQVTLYRLVGQEPASIAAWRLKSASMNQPIGSKGDNFVRELRLTVPGALIDRPGQWITLLDERGLIVDEYWY